MIDTEKAALEQRIDELCQENEQLRTANAAFTGRSIRAGDKMACLEAENAKLQKVCKRMHGHIKESCDVCDECYCSSWDEDNECCIFDSYMRALGIEVDEC